MSFPRRLGRIARGFAANLQEDDRLRETLRPVRERGEALRGAFEAALKGATEEWRAAEERRAAEDQRQPSGERADDRWTPPSFPRRYPATVIAAYDRLGLAPGASIEEADRKRRELIKRYHPDRFSEPEKRVRAERISAEINAAHDVIERHLRSK